MGTTVTKYSSLENDDGLDLVYFGSLHEIHISWRSYADNGNFHWDNFSTVKQYMGQKPIKKSQSRISRFPVMYLHKK